MGKASDYVRRVREANRRVREADERLNAYEGELYPEDLNEAAWQAIQHRNRVIRGKDR